MARGRKIRLTAMALCAASLAACATSRPEPPTRTSAQPATMRPYQVRGVWYRPKADPDYDETGVASWYGAQHHGRSTANGERFDMHVASAAHRTLPLPSVLEVTNLENGRKIRVRLNDRGPFVSDRLIDLSREAADELGFLNKGMARVRVRYVGPADGLRAQGVRVAARPAPAASPGPAPPIRGAEGGWDVQAASFIDSDNAERARRTLSSAGPTRVTTVERDGQTFYRLMLGPARSIDEAEQMRDQAARAGFADARVVGPS